ncbi:MAG: carboxylesterase family protein, partial [Treponema sp.]|nr:carboxylesterase family protein [Treponema sp.]
MARQFRCADTDPVVQTRAGKLRGFLLDGVYTFHGIKYADAKRFQAPEPVAPWEGVKDALSYGAIAPLLENPAPTMELLIPHRFWPENEHCQYLNVWTPALDRAAKKPVMVWLHGGGFSAGSSIEQVAYEGDRLSGWGDVVVVSLNHRLNILGYFDMSSFGERYQNSGNAGMADIVEALKWVRENIAAFGGDPGNITVFGQSGGGMKITALGQIPEAAGLFHKGIIMSGVLESPFPAAPRDDRAVATMLLEELGLGENDAEKLEIVPFQALARAFNRANRKLRKQGVFLDWGPRANDWYSGDPLQTGFSEFAKTFPTMVGSVIAEFGFGPGVPGRRELSPEERRAKVAERYGAHTDELITLFKKAYPGKNELDILNLDTLFRPGALHYIEKKAAEAAAPVYSYLFALEFDYDGGKSAWHCSDIPFVFRNTDRVAICNIEGVTEKLEDQISGAYVNFAKNGNPNNAALPEWPAWSGGKKAT